MLHDTGHYDPHEVPVNMGAPVNMSPLSTPMNIVQKVNNLGKTPQHTSQASAGHFSLSNYTSYPSVSQNLGSQINTFPTYHGLGLEQHCMPQNTSLMPNLSWQNDILPSDLNTHNGHYQNVAKFSQIDRLPPENVNNTKERNQSSKVTQNVPQVPNNIQTQIESKSENQLLFNNQYKPFDGHSNDDLHTKPSVILLHDNNRRKNLENTVRLIENILINTTKNRENKVENEERHSDVDSDEMDTKNIDTNSYTVPIEPKDPLQSPKIDEISTNIESSSAKTEYKIEISNTESTTENLNVTIKLEPEETSEVEVKIEPISSWTDSEYNEPFHKDVNGVLQEDVGCTNIIESETSVARATEVIKNTEETDSFFECPYCSLLFNHPKRFLIHTKWHLFGLGHEKRLELAKLKANRKKSKDDRQSKGTSSTRRNWPCKDCDKVFSARGGLESHRKRYHTNRTRECKICSKLITGYAPWRAHLATHNTDSGYQCPHCPKRFKYAHSLAKHKDTHLEKTHECPECPKKFGSQALLKVHMKSHTRLQKGASFHCSFCAKPFFEKFNLQIHERTHTNERPFVCEICNATFGCNSNLKRHMKVSHSSNKPFECPTCHRSFTTEGIRDRHTERVHSKPEDFKYFCKQCPGRFMIQSELKKHKSNVHSRSKNKESEDIDNDQ